MVVENLDDDTCFYENVFRNKGWKIRGFDDYDAGMNWLTDAAG